MGNAIFLFVAMFGLMYLLVIRPQAKQQAAHQGMIESLKKGDKLYTIGGILGTVAAVHEHEVTLKIDDKAGTRIRILKTAVHQKVSGEKGGD